MSERRRLFYKTIARWWGMVATEYDWGAPDTKELLEAEEILWSLKDRYEAGEIKLAEVKPVFDRWAGAHKKSMLASKEMVTATRQARREHAAPNS